MPQQDDHSAPRNPNFLVRQLERARFERALEVTESMVEKGAFLNTAELARLNEIILGQHGDPWREGPTVRTLPSGKTEHFQVLADPVNNAKELLRHAKDRASAGETIEAAADLYAQLVLAHVFKDANRRTAVVAAAYLLRLQNVYVSAMGLHELGLGDLRAPGQVEALRETLRNAVMLGGQRHGKK